MTSITGGGGRRVLQPGVDARRDVDPRARRPLSARLLPCGIWRFAADGSDAGPGGGTDLLAESGLKPDAALNSDVTIGEGGYLVPGADGETVLFTAPIDGSYELWRVALDGNDEPVRLTEDRHYLSGWDAVAAGDRDLVAAVRSASTTLPEVVVFEAAATARGTKAPRALSSLNDELAGEIDWSSPSSGAGRATAATSRAGSPGRERPPAAGARDPRWPAHALRLVADARVAGPRRSGGVGARVEPARLGRLRRGVQPRQPRRLGRRTDGATCSRASTRRSRTAWPIPTGWASPVARMAATSPTGSSDRPTGSRRPSRAAPSSTCGCCSSPATSRAPSGPGSSSAAARGRSRSTSTSISPLSLATNVRTPLLIQHSERDIRTTVAQAETLFTVLRSLRRPVRFMRVPDENHELTRGGCRTGAPRTSSRCATGSSTSWSAASAACPRRRRTAPAASRSAPSHRQQAHGPVVDSRA